MLFLTKCWTNLVVGIEEEPLDLAMILQGAFRLVLHGGSSGLNERLSVVNKSRYFYGNDKELFALQSIQIATLRSRSWSQLHSKQNERLDFSLESGTNGNFSHAGALERQPVCPSASNLLGTRSRYAPYDKLCYHHTRHEFDRKRWILTP